jgi:hypothetical protein
LADGIRPGWARAGLGRSLAIANLVGLGALLVLIAAPLAAAAEPATRNLDVYDARAALWQDPDKLACTSAAAQMMLNVVAYEATAEYFAPPDGRGAGPAPRWHPDTSHETTEAMLDYERSNMTMLAASAGSDPHGWRNALNYFGWGSVRAGAYVDAAYPSFDAAARAAVVALAQSRRPVGILARGGGHAQLVTGYVVSGEDPRAGGEFTILGVYLTDPLLSVGMRDAFVPLDTWRSGDAAVRFAPYAQTDSPFRDAIDGNAGTAEWYGKWVIVEPRV